MTRTRKLAAALVIAAYVGALGFGVVAHALKVGINYTASYFVVWDMFCGWSAYDQQTHLIAETTDGKFLDLSEPWGEFQPFGRVARVQYDLTNQVITRQIPHVLDRTQHDDVNRVFVVQEIWPKQYNMPRRIWDRYYSDPPDKLSYHHVRAICHPNGKPISVWPDWVVQQRLNSIADNPRLQQEVQRARLSVNTLYTPRGQNRSATAVRPTTN